jgi:DNA-binding transcriptional ArsR family regulator
LTIKYDRLYPSQMRRTSEDTIDQLFYALSDQNRRLMLKRLSKGSSTATELGEPLGITKQAVSKHLQVLEEVGLITKEKDGRIYHCRFNPEALDPVQKIVQQYREFWNQQLDALEEFIKKAKQSKNTEQES